MQIIIILIAINLALLFLVPRLWATKSRQFEDPYGPAYRVLFDVENDNRSKNKQNPSRKFSYDNRIVRLFLIATIS